MGQIGVLHARGMLIAALEIKGGIEPAQSPREGLICRGLTSVDVKNTAVGGIEPQLKEGVRVGRFGAGPIIGGQEAKA